MTKIWNASWSMKELGWAWDYWRWSWHLRQLESPISKLTSDCQNLHLLALQLLATGQLSVKYSCFYLSSVRISWFYL